MAERRTAASSGAVQEELVADLKCLTVRKVHWRDWFKGAGALGVYTPIPSVWRDGRHLELGEKIDTLVREEDAAIRLLGLSSEALPRRAPKNGCFTGWQYSEIRSGKPLYHAGVTGVENMDAGRGRLLPVLRLMEFTPQPDGQEYMVSLPDLAHYVQGHEVELSVS
jgi:hypothetical protein